MLELTRMGTEGRAREGAGQPAARGVAPKQSVARVVGVDGRDVSVRVGGRRMHARRAVSCLVEPEPGDAVLLFETREGDAWVLAILERTSDAPIRIGGEGDLEVKPSHGKLRLGSGAGVEVESGVEVSLRAPTLRMQAGEATIAARSLSYVGAAVGAQVDRVRLTAARVDAVVDRVSQVMKSFYRVVSETEHARAGRLDYTADESLSLRGQTTFVTAAELCKLDGDQVHVG